MRLSRRSFLGSAAAACAAAPVWAQAEGQDMKPPRIIYYNNFASHLLCAFNPNMYYPDLPHRWSDDDWRRLIDMIARFGFNVFEFWLEPRLFCREALASPVGTEFARQMNAVIEHAHARGMQAEMIVAIATVGEQWRTLCPNLPNEWAEIRFLWDAWVRRFPALDIAGIFPGDPGACSRNGCTAETYIDKSIEIAVMLDTIRPGIGIEFNTWGPPFFGWGNIHMPPGSRGEFIPEDQASAWTFSKDRADRSMNHLLKRLGEFPEHTAISINMGFNSDGNPTGDQDARPWANAIAKTRRILTWDFSLTEGENAVYPHYRFTRLFQRRKEERAAAPYSGGICFTMTPLLNQLSLYEAAQSFRNCDGDPHRLAGDFMADIFGEAGRSFVPDYRLFEIIPDWGCYDVVKMPRAEYHRRMAAFADRLEDAKGSINHAVVLHPDPETYRAELAFFARLFADLTAPAPDYDLLKKTYWNHVYRIYDCLPDHVDPRPRANTDRFIRHFAEWST
ncbi:MAG TPA: twin-arginine translocation signal domain-containing protein [Candidatus Hydrogenedentes bacterium]|nr:twin-arginine translocation signal domain-containing protein [Candidatus Hydrogenedentota bacterium]HRT18913.1 twin-arginine translocation signal domain-containing protein [Candidatus Hydrogenedentota bacterium]HRT64975.1 twin-arginine translocation signal domain-containing protein [Candidatus Hydrogenedentota bacterium]